MATRKRINDLASKINESTGKEADWEDRAKGLQEIATTLDAADPAHLTPKTLEPLIAGNCTVARHRRRQPAARHHDASIPPDERYLPHTTHPALTRLPL